MDLKDLQASLARFAAERDWDQFHTPKNLAMAVAGEAGELVAEFQWLTAEQSGGLDSQSLGRVAAEMADVLIYLARLADVLGVDLLAAAEMKLEQNRLRYEANAVRGSADKQPHG